MGWWSDGDDVMGDEPADQVGELFRTLLARLQREDRHGVTVDGLAEAFGEAIAHSPALVAPAVSGSAARAALAEALTELCAAAGYIPVRRTADLYGHTWVVHNAVHRLSMAWVDSGLDRRPRLSELVSAFTFVARPRVEALLAVHEPVTRHPILHPLVGAPRATLADLRARCTPEALALLDQAARVARLRVHGALGEVPLSGLALSLRSTDLLRALQVAGPVRALGYDDDWTPAFERDTRRVAAILATEVEPPPELSLDQSWVGHLTVWLAGRPGPIDATALLGALDRAALRSVGLYSVNQADGLLMGDEAVMTLSWAQRRLAGWSAWRPEHGGHLDRDGELDALSSALAASRVLRLETDTLGRVMPLLQAWADRVGRTAELPVETEPTAGCAALLVAIGASPKLAALQAEDLERELWTEQVDTLLAGDQVLVLATAPGALGRRLPALAQAPVLELGERRDADLLARWLAVRARSWLTSGERYDLFELFDAITAADEEDRWSLDWSRLGPWLQVPSRRRSVASGQLRRLLKAKRPMPMPESAVFQRFVQTEARLRWLVELDEGLP